MSAIKFRLVDDILTSADFSSGKTTRMDLPPGSAQWRGPRAANGFPNGLIAVCPCGCGAVFSLDVNVGAVLPRQWGWDGNMDKPTLVPSVRRMDGCQWHGHLMNGEWIKC